MVINLLSFAQNNPLTTILHFFLAFVVLMVMVFIHELGHYIAGKLLKFKITEFSIGMGPSIFTYEKKNGEKISLRALPLGGFCSFYGEDSNNNELENHNDGISFYDQKPWKRIIVLFSGAFFNFISAVLIAVIFFSCFGEYKAIITSVEPNSPNYSMVQVGDVIQKVDEKEIFLISDVSDYIANADDNNISLTVLRNGSVIQLNGLSKSHFDRIDENGETHNVYGIGISYSYTQERVLYSLPDSLGRALPYCLHTAKVVLKTLGDLITGLIGLDALGGPITTITITSQVVASGFENVLQLIILFSVNLAVFNLLPVPALDGCQIIFTLGEWIFRKPINKNVQSIINFVGLILLLTFTILIDILRL